MSSLHASMIGTEEKQPRKSGDTVFSHHNSICYHGNQWLDLAEFQTHPSSHVRYHYLQMSKESYQEQPSKSGDIIFPIMMTPGRGQFRPQGHDWQDLCRVPLNIATH